MLTKFTSPYPLHACKNQRWDQHCYIPQQRVSPRVRCTCTNHQRHVTSRWPFASIAPTIKFDPTWKTAGRISDAPSTPSPRYTRLSAAVFSSSFFFFFFCFERETTTYETAGGNNKAERRLAVVEMRPYFFKSFSWGAKLSRKSSNNVRGEKRRGTGESVRRQRIGRKEKTKKASYSTLVFMVKNCCSACWNLCRKAFSGCSHPTRLIHAPIFILFLRFFAIWIWLSFLEIKWNDRTALKLKHIMFTTILVHYTVSTRLLCCMYYCI